MDRLGTGEEWAPVDVNSGEFRQTILPWERHYDHSTYNTYFYFNRHTQESQWKLPLEVIAKVTRLQQTLLAR